MEDRKKWYWADHATIHTWPQYKEEKQILVSSASFQHDCHDPRDRWLDFLRIIDRNANVYMQIRISHERFLSQGLFHRHCELLLVSKRNAFISIFNIITLCYKKIFNIISPSDRNFLSIKIMFYGVFRMEVCYRIDKNWEKY